MRFKERTKIMLLILGCFVVAGVFYWMLFAILSEEPAPLSRNSVLELTLSGEIPERAAEDPLREALGTAPVLSLQDVLQVIRKAARDEKIVGILLRPEGMLTGWAKVREIRQALEQFKETGKPIYAFLEMAGNKEYYLATVADTIVGISTGILFVNGFLSEPVFLKNTLAKIGIEADFVAHGKYKNAPDMVTRERMSDAQREVINAILDQYYEDLVTTLTDARHLEASTVRAHIDRGLLDMKKAREAGLVDTLMYYHDLKEYLKEHLGKGTRMVSFNRYKKVPFSRLGISPKHTLAVVFGVGTIVIGGEEQFGQDGLITSEGMAASIRKAAEDKEVKAIILRIDSPGGSGTASDVIWREVVKAREKKPVIVSVSDLAASGGYYISMAADTIVAQPNSLVGSIGVFAGKFAWQGFYRKIGMNVEKITRGRNADFFSSTGKFTPEQREILRQFIMDFYQDFITKVGEGRGMPPEEVDRIAQGRVWTGKQGHQLGLVDVLGDFQTAVQIAKEMAGLPPDEPVKLKVYPHLKSFIERLLESDLSTGISLSVPELQALPPVLRNIIVALPHFRTGEPLFLLPFDIGVN